jgi:AraC-like DNA-binding protein
MFTFVVISTLGAAQALFLSALLFGVARGKRSGNTWLGGFILSFGLLSAQDAIDGALLPIRVWQLAHFFDPLIFVLAPLLYLYVRAITNQPEKRAPIILAHLLPCVLVFGLVQTALRIPAPEERSALVREDYLGNPSVDPLLIVVALQMAVYWVLSVRRLRGYEQRLKQSYSEIERLNFRWIRVLLGVMTVLFAFWLIGLFVAKPILVRFNILACSISVYALGYVGLREARVFVGEIEESGPEAFREASPSTTEESAQKEPAEEDIAEALTGTLATKYAKSGLSSGLARSHLARLDQHMSTKKPYLQMALTLRELAEQLDISVHHLSQVINQNRGENFFDYVNRLRINEAQRHLADPTEKDKTVLDIAFEIGFSSKASFNAAFRKYARTTPTRYRKAQLPD